MDVSDLLALLAAFGGSTDGDTDADGDTDVTDLLNLLAAYGTASCGLLRPRILVVGGNDGAGDLATAELYDPSADAWSAAASMATAREGNAVAAIGGLVYAMAGTRAPSHTALTSTRPRSTTRPRTPGAQSPPWGRRATHRRPRPWAAACT